jgi:hypothetical protein
MTAVRVAAVAVALLALGFAYGHLQLGNEGLPADATAPVSQTVNGVTQLPQDMARMIFQFAGSATAASTNGSAASDPMADLTH